MKERPPPLQSLKSSPIPLSCWWDELSPLLPFTGHTQHQASFILLTPTLSHLATSELREISSPTPCAGGLQPPQASRANIKAIRPWPRTEESNAELSKAQHQSPASQPALSLMCFLHLISDLVKAQSKHGARAEHLLVVLGEPELASASGPVLQASDSGGIILYSGNWSVIGYFSLLFVPLSTKTCIRKPVCQHLLLGTLYIYRH